MRLTGAALMMAGVLASGLWTGSAMASGSAQGPPALPTSAPFEQCAAVYEDPSCGYLIDVTNAAQPTVFVDPSIGFYEKEDDVLVGVQNDSSSPISEIHVGVPGSGLGSFGFDGDGLCTPGGAPVPGECPFGPLGDPGDYFGPDTVLTPASPDDGTVSFPAPLQPGQYTYFSLESPFSGATVVAGNHNDAISTSLSTPTASGARITEAAQVQVTDTATLRGANAQNAEIGTKVIYRLYSDAACSQEVPIAGKTGGDEKTVAVVGELPPSDPAGATLPTNATYYWRVEYAGDKQGNERVLSNCGDETMTFGTPPSKPQAEIATFLKGASAEGATQLTVTLGAAVTDSVSVVSGGQRQSGRVTYFVYSDSACHSQVPGANLGNVVSTNGLYGSSAPVVLPVGTYYFQAVYSGNSATAGGRSACGAEVLNVITPPPAPAHCACASLKTYMSHFHIFGRGSTRLEMQLSVAIECTAGAGGCAGEVLVRAPKGAKFIDTTKHPRGVKAAPPTETLKFVCSGPCAARTIQRATLTWVALKTTTRKHGKRTITVTKPIPSFLPRGRAKKNKVVALETICYGPNGVVLRSDSRLTIHFDKHGQVDYRKSDLNGDGRPDGKQLIDLTGF